VLTQKELLSYRVFLFNLCTQKRIIKLWVLFIICVDTERILETMGIIYLIYVHKNNIGIYWVLFI